MEISREKIKRAAKRRRRILIWEINIDKIFSLIFSYIITILTILIYNLVEHHSEDTYHDVEKSLVNTLKPPLNLCYKNGYELYSETLMRANL